MCGIVGYLGKKERNLKEVLIHGLKLLEYRGYDSSGIAVLNGSGIELYKKSGKIKELEKQIKNNPLKAKIGIGHTRWATHGEPNDFNAHPHTDCREKIAVVHNGIIENYHELKKEMIAKNHIIKSDTDSEIIAHLIEEEEKNSPDDFSKAVINTLGKLKGTYALVIINSNFKDSLYIARNGSPLVVGVDENSFYIASDIPALLPFTKKIIILDDYQIGIIKKGEINLFNIIDGNKVVKEPIEVNWNQDEISRANFSHYMLKEINEQPLVARRIYKKYVTPNKGIDFSNVKFDSKFYKNIKKIYIQACGTSYHAGLVAKYLFEKFLQLPTEVDISSEFRYRMNFFEKDSLLVTITQSGETADSLAGLRLAKAHHIPTLSICNVISSSIARESDSTIYIEAGPEIGVASTKAYTAQILVLYLLMLFLAELRDSLRPYRIEEMLSEIRKLPLMMENILSTSSYIKKIAEELYFPQGFLFIGRGINYPTALESALKLKEIAYIHSTGYPAGEMKHGPIALIDENLPTVCIAPQGELYEKMYSNIQEIHARRGRIISVINEGDEKVKSLSEFTIEIPKSPEELSPLLCIIPLQLLSYYIGIGRGCDVDKPRNLAKSVTVE
jgi:glucosamine--fructose-6-phosphate aminotransferase (isomerizing)